MIHLSQDGHGAIILQDPLNCYLGTDYLENLIESENLHKKWEKMHLKI